MRWLIPLGALAAFAFAQTATAAPVTVADVSIAPQFQTQLERKLGVREGAYLQETVSRAVARALQHAGADVTSSAGVRVETTILDAVPNHPTFEEVGRRPGLSMFDSISIGGASLSGVIRGANGQVLAQVDHRHYSTSLFEVLPGTGEWSDAQHAIWGYAHKVAEAYVAHVR